MSDIIIDGKVRVSFVPTIADLTQPSVAELNAGTLLQTTMIPAGLEGFESSTADVDNTSLASTFDTKLPGRLSYSGTGLVFKKQDGVDTIWTLMTVPGTNGFVVIRANGIDQGVAWTAAQTPIEVYPVRTSTHIPLGKGESNSLERYRVPTMITATPQLKATVKA